jgi:hypothetical protein
MGDLSVLMGGGGRGEGGRGGREGGRGGGGRGVASVFGLASGMLETCDHTRIFCCHGAYLSST